MGAKYCHIACITKVHLRFAKIIALKSHSTTPCDSLIVPAQLWCNVLFRFILLSLALFRPVAFVV